MLFCVLLLVSCLLVSTFFFFFKQKTAYELRISDWSSDVCSSDLDFAAHRIDPLLLIGREHFQQQAALLAPGLQGAQQPELQGVMIRVEIGRASCRERVWQYV